jgi:Beta-ketoacyl synthase, N-terminal domain
MLGSILYDVLKEPIKWCNVTAGCVEYVATSSSSSWVVRPFGPTFAAGSLVSALKAEAKVEAVLDDCFGSSDPLQPGTVTKEPIAIVGMAGRFPEAMSHDELWKLLERGIDCHKVVSSFG